MGRGVKIHQYLDCEKLAHLDDADQHHVYPFSKNIQVVFLLDITTSMGPRLDLMKSIIAAFCADERNGIDIHVWTFTESGNCCYVDASPLELNGSRLVNYVKDIKLGVPPSMPNVLADGGDGPENCVAAVAHLTERFSSNHNILCFIITDASPHYSIANSTEAKAEKAWLRDHGHQETDCSSFFPKNYNGACPVRLCYWRCLVSSGGWAD